MCSTSLWTRILSGNSAIRLILCALVVLAITGCTSWLIKPYPPQKTITPRSDSTVAPELDFFLAFADTAAHDSSAAIPDSSSDSPIVGVPRGSVRIALSRERAHASFFAPSGIRITDTHERLETGSPGLVRIENTRVGGIVRILLGPGNVERFALPCTLFSRDQGVPLEFESHAFRGAFVVAQASSPRFHIINVCDVEDYLRGVIPLELGPIGFREVEAAKAQAIAARTYTYQRILTRTGTTWDVVPTVADQVYGGVAAETALYDRAVLETQDKVLVYNGRLVPAYYHSTCGGKTATIENVWDKPPHPCLVSVDDTDLDGHPWCAASRYCSWRETWPADVLSRILSRYGTKAFPQHPFTGTLKKIAVPRRFPCGRIQSCLVSNGTQSVSWGGDRIRFAFRRNQKNHPILRSSHFTVESQNSRTVTLRGRGYGHGVGMCQVGALGRARAGQDADTILRAYYTGAMIGSVRIDENVR